jgi:hypothetical protein
MQVAMATPNLQKYQLIAVTENCKGLLEMRPTTAQRLGGLQAVPGDWNGTVAPMSSLVEAPHTSCSDAGHAIATEGSTVCGAVHAQCSPQQPPLSPQRIVVSQCLGAPIEWWRLLPAVLVLCG